MLPFSPNASFPQGPLSFGPGSTSFFSSFVFFFLHGTLARPGGPPQGVSFFASGGYSFQELFFVLRATPLIQTFFFFPLTRSPPSFLSLPFSFSSVGPLHFESAGPSDPFPGAPMGSTFFPGRSSVPHRGNVFGGNPFFSLALL